MNQTDVRVVEYPYWADPYQRRRDIDAEIREWLSSGWQVLSVQYNQVAAESKWIVTYWR